jgi:muramidase (phage lysozyme)
MVWVPGVSLRGGLLLASALMLLPAGCSGVEEEDDAAALEGESALKEMFDEGTDLRVTASALNVRADGTRLASIRAVLHRDDVVRVIRRSGENGWVQVSMLGPDRKALVASASACTPTMRTCGWVFSKYVQRLIDPVRSSAGSCNPARAEGAVGQYQQILHDTIALAEGTRPRTGPKEYESHGYDFLFNDGIASTSDRFTSCADHPKISRPFGRKTTNAAGRYQFMGDTWDSAVEARGFDSFEPENQERAAAYQIALVRKVIVPQDRPMTETEFSNALVKLSYEWAGLPPSRYGQTDWTERQLWNDYCRYAGTCVAQE